MKTTLMPLLRAVLRLRLRDLSPHRLRLRLRARWLAWRGVASLQLVSGPVRPPRPALRTLLREQEGRRHALKLVEFNLMLERARAGQDRQGRPGGIAR